MLDPSKQRTLKGSVSLSGIGLFTGAKATITIHPARANSGIVFQRTDLPGKPQVTADLDHVVNTPRCTILGNHKFTIHTVEHLLSALRAMGIDNAVLEISGPEVPIMDGSAEPFVEAILKGGIKELGEEKEIYTLEYPVSWSKGEIHLVAMPAKEFRVSYTLHFPESTLLKSQYFSIAVNPHDFAQAIAPCRTFCLYEEIAPFIESGLIKGGGLDNAVIIKNDVVINPDGVRFDDEMVRHKILDLIGDLSLVSNTFHAHVIAIRSGHASNVAFARELLNHLKLEKA
ncbi:MAG: UDP-3-O-[3-hydroxymyristoyl] N-acetylglucosamine deacetylase [Verrucomicrobia bacterium]|nr:UDP-3-O-[3-hydroxymyristoyl] N-acetylglucosamine deacetylase [Verrucomicrobiota bacterium]